MVSSQPLFAGEEPPLYQGNLHRLKVAWIDCANHSVEFEIESIRGAFHYSEDHVAFKAAARRCRRAQRYEPLVMRVLALTTLREMR